MEARSAAGRWALAVTLGIAATLILGCRAAPGTPELVLHHGKIFTADTSTPWVEAVLIRGERIERIGSSDEILAAASASARRVDLEGRTVVPGFNDAHDHIAPPTPGVEFATGADPLPDPELVPVLDSVRSVAARVPEGTWITSSIGERLLTDPRARRAALDQAAPKHPVALLAWSGHGMILNSAGLDALGVADWMGDPQGGRFERGTDGRVTGLIEEYASWALWPRFFGGNDSANVRAAFAARAREGVRWGITSMQSMLTGIDPETLRALLPTLDPEVRLRLIRFPLTKPEGPVLAPWLGLGSAGRVVLSGTKWILDGTPVERLAVGREPYADRAGWYGRLDFPPDTLRLLLQDALDRNDQPLIHAVGDSAIALVLTTMAALAPDSVWRVRRLRIEHGDGTYPDLIPVVRRLGAIIVQNPTHLALGSLAVARNGPARMAGYQPLRSLLDGGVPLALASDGPLNPFLNLMFAVIHPDNPAESLTMEQAVRAYTWGSAYAEFAEQEKGRLVPGMLADLAVLSQDIFAVDPQTLPGTMSLLTLVGGRAVHDPEGWLR